MYSFSVFCHLTLCLRDSSRFLYVADSTSSVHFIVWIYHIVLIHSAVGTFVSSLRLLSIFLLQKHTPFSAHVLRCVGSVAVSGTVVSWVFICSALVGKCQIAFPSGGQIYGPNAAYGSSGSTFLPKPGVFGDLNVSHPSGWVLPWCPVSFSRYSNEFWPFGYFLLFRCFMHFFLNWVIHF